MRRLGLVAALGVGALVVVLLVGLRGGGDGPAAGRDSGGGGTGAARGDERPAPGQGGGSRAAAPRRPVTAAGGDPAPGGAGGDDGELLAPGDYAAELAYGEPVADESECDATCGAPCLKTPDGGRACPVRCDDDTECERGAVCTAARPDRTASRIKRCLPSECREGDDAECGAGRTCLPFAGKGRTSFLCRDSGPRQKGDSCVPAAAGAQAGLCGPGLSCVGGVCEASTCKAETDCAAQNACMPGPDGVSRCADFCDGDRECGEGMKCLGMPWNPGRRRCVPAGTCVENDCPAGSYCNVDHYWAWDFQASCVRTCTAGDAAGCGDGEFCAAPLDRNRDLAETRCWRRCEPGVAGTCPQGWICNAVSGSDWACIYDSSAAGIRQFGAP